MVRWLMPSTDIMLTTDERAAVPPVARSRKGRSDTGASRVVVGRGRLVRDVDRPGRRVAKLCIGLLLDGHSRSSNRERCVQDTDVLPGKESRVDVAHSAALTGAHSLPARSAWFQFTRPTPGTCRSRHWKYTSSYCATTLRRLNWSSTRWRAARPMRSRFPGSA